MADAVGDLQLNDAQAAAADILIYASSSTGISQVLSNNGTSSLLARNFKYGPVQGPLPNDQWTLEVQNWVNIILAQLQRTVLEYATGPSDLDVLQFLTARNVSSEERLCRNQKARSGQAQNFSVLAIIIILVVGIFIILIDSNLDRLIGYVQRQKDASNY